MKSKGRIDGNQNDIVKNLRKAGCSVAITSSLGGGFPDLVVGLQGRTYLFEIKDPTASKADQKLTMKEFAWHQLWRGQVDVIKSWEEAWEIINGE